MEATATVNNASNPTETAAIPKKSTPAWAEKLKRAWALTRLTHEVVCLDNLRGDRGVLRRLVRKTQDGTIGKPDAVGLQAVEDSMGDVAVGNEIHNHYYGEKPLAPAAASPIADFLKKAAIAAALMASGAGAGVGIPWLLGAFEKAAPAVVPAATESIDTDTQYELRLGSGATP